MSPRGTWVEDSGRKSHGKLQERHILLTRASLNSQNPRLSKSLNVELLMIKFLAFGNIEAEDGRGVDDLIYALHSDADQ